jgi:hypothetical protein
MLRPTRVELIERLKKLVGLPQGDRSCKTLGYLSRKDITELITFAEEVKAERQGHTGQ